VRPCGFARSPIWVCSFTHMGLLVHPCGFARSPVSVRPCTHVGVTSYQDGSAHAPIWVCQCTHLGTRMHPDGFGLVPRWVRPRTQMGGRKDPPVFRTALGAGGPKLGCRAGFHEGERGHSCPLHAWVFAAAPPFQKKAGVPARLS